MKPIVGHVLDLGLQIVMQSLQVRESTEQIKEAKNVTNLTRLAFVFVPLAFIASIFGINVEELGQGSTSIWVFFAVIAPVALVLVSLLFFPPALTLIFSEHSSVYQRVKRHGHEICLNILNAKSLRLVISWGYPSLYSASGWSQMPRTACWSLLLSITTCCYLINSSRQQTTSGTPIGL